MAPKISTMLALLTCIASALSIFACSGFVSGTPLEFSEKTIIVRKGGDFQAALEAAKPGDTIMLEAGANFRGAFKLPTKSGNEFITIRTSAADDKLPPADTRLIPSKYQGVLAKLESNVRGKPTILRQRAHTLSIYRHRIRAND